MDRYLVRRTASQQEIVETSVAVSRCDRTQRTLHGLKKVVRMGKTSVIVFDDADIAQACSVLSDKNSSDNLKLESLRKLSCWQISKANLMQSPQIGKQVRVLKHHRNRDVAALACRLIQKWKDIVMSARPSNVQSAPVQAMLAAPALEPSSIVELQQSDGEHLQ